MGKLCFGVDLGGTTVKMGIFTVEGSLLEDWEIPTRKEDKGAYILDDIADDFKISASTVKLIYIVYLETTQGNDISTRALDFVPKQLYKQVIAELQNRLAELIGG